MVKIFVFDTETTDKGPVGDTPGLDYNEKRMIESALVEKNAGIATSYWDQWVHLWPYITQLGYIVYDTENPQNAKIFDKYIDIPAGIEISPGSSKVTRIFTTDEDVVKKAIIDDETGQLITPDTPGIFILSRIKESTPSKMIPISDAIAEFMEDLKTCDYVVGHNVDFDKKMILAELKRLNRDPDFYGVLAMDNFVCTMMKTINVCKIEARTKFGKKYFKFPKLKEAYQTLFGYEPSGPALHNAIIDVVICLRVFCKLGDPVDVDVCGTNDEITELINSFSPAEFQCPIKKAGKARKPRKRATSKKGGKPRRSKRIQASKKNKK